MGGDLRWTEELLQQNIHAPRHLGEKEVSACQIPYALFLLIPLRWRCDSKSLWRWSFGRAADCSSHAGARGEGRGRGEAARASEESVSGPRARQRCQCSRRRHCETDRGRCGVGGVERMVVDMALSR